ncbi:MAG: hypothetical protein M0R80_03425 [Proteobacteria bacterium]|jgi:hypothetical protein|nr:hypothetical protein [Pseudomonadota bacterium]
MEIKGAFKAETIVAGNINYSADTGAANAYVVSLGLNYLFIGLPVSFKASHDNTGASTLKVDSLPAVAIKKNVSDALDMGDIKTGQVITVIYDGIYFQIASALGSGISGYSGYSGIGISGYSGYSGDSGISGYSGYSGDSGISGYSGYSGDSGISGYSGYSGSGISGYSGYSGSGISGYSGYSGSGISGYSGYSGTTNIYLGNPTTGDYLDGLFPWEPNVTLIADAEQEVNEVLAALAPAPAPNFSTYNNAQTTGATGKLSFDGSYPIGGVSNVDGIGNCTSVAVDGAFTYNALSGMRRGVFSSTTTSFTGQLASNIVAEPNGAYLQYAFIDGDTGILSIYVNNDVTPKHTVDLSIFSSGSSLNGNGTGFTSISAVTYEKFPNGSDFTLFVYRTAQWVVNTADCREGWNWVRITHTVGTDRPPTNLYCDFIRDLNTTTTTFSADTLTGFTGSGSKYLSGVNYYTGGSATYAATISNLYRNTWYTGSDAIAYSFNSTPLQALTNESLGNSGGDEALDVTKSKTVNITSSSTRLNPTAGHTISVRTTAKRTVQSTQSSSYRSITDILLDNFVASSTVTAEYFDDETYRLPSNSDFDNDATAVTSSWTSSNTIADAGSAGYNDGTQTYNGTLVYPTMNFSTIANGPAGNVNYSTGISGERCYYRFFDMLTTARSNFTLTVNGASITPISNGTAFSTTSQIKIDIKLPNDGGEGTGWLDVTALFATAHWSDGDGCLLSGTFSMNSAMSITVGTKSTGAASVNGKVFLRIRVPSGWIRNLTSITLVGA